MFMVLRASLCRGIGILILLFSVVLSADDSDETEESNGEVGLLQDQIVFTNGDRLSGRYLRQEDGYYHFQSERFGEMRVSTQDAEVIRADAGVPTLPVVPLAEVLTPEEATPEVLEPEPEPVVVAEVDSPPPNEEVVEEEVAEETKELPPGVVYRIPVVRTGVEKLEPIFEFLSRFELLPGWKSRFTLGHVWQKGQVDQSAFNLRFTTERRVSNRYEAFFDGRYNYGKQRVNEVTTKSIDHYNARLRYRKILNPHFFAQSNTRYEKDLIKRIEHDAEQSLGIGWRFLERDQFRGSLTPSLSGRYRAQSNRPSDEWRLFFTLFQDFEYRINSYVGLFQEFTYSIEASDADRYNYDGRLRMETKLTAKLSLNVAWEYSYDNTVAPNIQASKQRATTSLSIDF